tara:strand:- start:333 stop:587 length:255 start_codon:yes stop_codon:yes gene_type:complete
MSNIERMKEINQSMYGLDNFDEYARETSEMLDTGLTNPTIVIMSELSDAQEELARGNSESARQRINRAKSFLGRFTITEVNDGN